MTKVLENGKKKSGNIPRYLTVCRMLRRSLYIVPHMFNYPSSLFCTLSWDKVNCSRKKVKLRLEWGKGGLQLVLVLFHFFCSFVPSLQTESLEQTIVYHKWDAYLGTRRPHIPIRYLDRGPWFRVFFSFHYWVLSAMLCISPVPSSLADWKQDSGKFIDR